MSDTSTSTTTSTGNGSTDGGGQQADATTGSDQQQTQNQQQPGGQSSGQQGGSNQQQAGDGDRKFSQADLDKAIDQRMAREKNKQDKAADQVAAAQREAQEAKDGQQRLLDVIAEATGQKKSDQPPDPAALQQTLTQRENRVSELEGENTDLRIELDAWRIAVENGANPIRLMNSRSFHDKLRGIDRKAEDRGKQIGTLVTTEIEADESLKAATTPRTPRPDPSQGSGRPAPTGAERGVAEAQRRFGNQQQAAGKST